MLKAMVMFQVDDIVTAGSDEFIEVKDENSKTFIRES